VCEVALKGRILAGSVEPLSIARQTQHERKERPGTGRFPGPDVILLARRRVSAFFAYLFSMSESHFPE